MKTHTDYNQSKKLAEILPPESADMLFPPEEEGFADVIRVPLTRERWTQMAAGMIPAWSLSALLEVLPKIRRYKPIIDLEDFSIRYYYESEIAVTSDNLINACYEMIIRLHELNLL